MMAFIYTCGLLMPLAVTIMGFKYNYAMMAAVVGLLVEISRRGKLVRLVDCWPAIAGMAGWIACNLFWGWPTEDHILDNKRAFLSCGYGLIAGYCLQLSSRRGRETPVLMAYVCFSLGLAVMAIKVIQFGNVDVEVGVVRKLRAEELELKEETDRQEDADQKERIRRQVENLKREQVSKAPA